jgi:hypothetical protein
MASRSLTKRERDVLDALLAVDFPGVQALRTQAKTVEVVAVCGCGCPSIDFCEEWDVGLHVRVNAAIDGRQHDGLLLFTLGVRLGGIEYVGNSEEKDPTEFPDAALLIVGPA